MPIIQISGFPGSGKTSYLLNSLIQHGGKSIFIDCESSLATRNVISFPNDCDIYRVYTIHELIAVVHGGYISLYNAIICIDGLWSLIKGLSLPAIQVTKILAQLMMQLHKLVHAYQLTVLISNNLLPLKHPPYIVPSLGPVFSRYFNSHICLNSEQFTALSHSIS